MCNANLASSSSLMIQNRPVPAGYPDIQKFDPRKTPASKLQVTNFATHSKIPQMVKSEITDKLASMCALDMRPFDIVEGAKFQAFALALINLGARMGKIDAGWLLPHPTSISRHVRAMLPEAEKSIKKDIERSPHHVSGYLLISGRTCIVHSTI